MTPRTGLKFQGDRSVRLGNLPEAFCRTLSLEMKHFEMRWRSEGRTGLSEQAFLEGKTLSILQGSERLLGFLHEQTYHARNKQGLGLCRLLNQENVLLAYGSKSYGSAEDIPYSGCFNPVEALGCSVWIDSHVDMFGLGLRYLSI